MHLNLIQVAQSLGVEESVVMAWVRHDALPCVKDSGRLLFDRSQVATWATERGLAARACFLAPAARQDSSRNDDALGTMLQRGGIWRGIDPEHAPSTLAVVIDGITGLTPDIRRMLVQRVQSPAAITWAPVGNSFAVPHLRSRVALGRESGLISLLLLTKALPLDEETPDGFPVLYLLFFMAPSPRSHLEVLAGLSALISRRSFRELIRSGAPAAEIFKFLAQPDPTDETGPGPPADPLLHRK